MLIWGGLFTCKMQTWSVSPTLRWEIASGFSLILTSLPAWGSTKAPHQSAWGDAAWDVVAGQNCAITCGLPLQGGPEDRPCLDGKSVAALHGVFLQWKGL